MITRPHLPVLAAFAASLLASSCATPATDSPTLRGWSLVGEDAASYRLTGDARVVHGGSRSARIEAIDPKPDGAGVLAQSFSAQPFRGLRVRFSAFTRTEDVAGWSGLWMRVERPDGASNFDNMQDRPVRGTSGWAANSVVLDVPHDATSIRIGALQDGAGRTWIDDARFEIVGDEVPVTTADKRPLTLADGDFERATLGAHGWFLNRNAVEGFDLAFDQEVAHGGKRSARLSRRGDEKRHGVVMQSIRADRLRGSRLRLRAWVRGSQLEGRGDLWARVQGADSPADGAGLGYGACALAGTFDWRICELVLDVDARADAVQIGLGVSGAGVSWIDDVTLEPVQPERVALEGWTPTPLALINGDFEAGDTPTGWVMSGGAARSYEAKIDRDQRHGGAASATLAARGDVPKGGYATLLQCVGADALRGNRVRATAWVRGDGITARGDVWMRVQAADSPGDGGGLGGGYCKLAGSFDWRACVAVFDVPKDAARVEIGGGLAGPGRLWLDDVSIEAVDPSVPLTRRDERPTTVENGGFEAAGDAPAGWSLWGGGKSSFTIAVDREVHRGGAASARIASIAGASPDTGYGTLAQRIDARSYRGRRVKIRAFAKGEGVEGRGDVWMRLQAQDSPGDGAGLGNQRCAVAKTFDWTLCEAVLDVPDHTADIQIGAGLGGRGTLWLDDVTLEVVGDDVPTSSIEKGDRSPRNLDFEDVAAD